MGVSTSTPCPPCECETCASKQAELDSPSYSTVNVEEMKKEIVFYSSSLLQAEKDKAKYKYFYGKWKQIAERERSEEARELQKQENYWIPRFNSLEQRTQFKHFLYLLPNSIALTHWNKLVGNLKSENNRPSFETALKDEWKDFPTLDSAHTPLDVRADRISIKEDDEYVFNLLIRR